jgi:succinyl-CoA synthetase alpha subunit
LNFRFCSGRSLPGDKVHFTQLPVTDSIENTLPILVIITENIQNYRKRRLKGSIMAFCLAIIGAKSVNVVTSPRFKIVKV